MGNDIITYILLDGDLNQIDDFIYRHKGIYRDQDNDETEMVDEFGNLLYRIEKKYSITDYTYNESDTSNMLGNQIDVYMDSIGQTIPEYLVNFEYFISLTRETASSNKYAFMLSNLSFAFNMFLDFFIVRYQPFISIPMETHVPRIISTACSIVLAFKSFSFISAIVRRSSSEIEPTLFRFGSPDPFAIFAAFKINLDAGGVLVIKVKLLSA